MSSKQQTGSKAEANQAKIMADFSTARQDLLAAAVAVPVEHRDTVFLGTWSLGDLLAHLVGWDYTNLQAAQEILAGQLPIVYSQCDKDWQTYNAGLVTRYKGDDFSKLWARLGVSHRELVEFLAAIPAEEFSKDRGLRSGRYKVTVAQFIKFETYDEQRHAKQVRAYAEGTGKE